MSQSDALPRADEPPVPVAPVAIAAEPERRPPTRMMRRPRWWRELVYVVGFYVVYSMIRNTQGSAAGGIGSRAAGVAYAHAVTVVRIERDLWLYHERTLQGFFIHARAFVQFWDVFYGTAHFGVTALALVWLFTRQPERYRLWRNTLAFTTAIALIGFAFFPLMPPRLLPVPYGFVDTLRTFGGAWSFDSGTMQRVSNQFAAMPSLHFGWSVWSAGVLFPAVRRPWAKALALAYPLATLFAIVVTANHYLLDALGGAVVCGTAYLLARAVTPAREGSGARATRRPALIPGRA